MKITAEFRQAALRHGFIPVSRKSADTPANILYAGSLELANLGFRVAPEELSGISTTSLTDTISEARAVIGADRAMRPIYPGFPQQVQELDTLTLIFEQVLHYWAAGEFLPNYPDVAREGLPLEDMGRADRVLRVLPAIDVAKEMITAFTQSGVALSDGDKEMLQGCVDFSSPSLEEVVEILRNSRHGENMQTLVRGIAVKNQGNAKHSVSELVQTFVPTAKNADQLLRVVLTLTANRSDRVANSDVSAQKYARNFDRAVYALSDRDYRAIRMTTVSRPARRAIVERLGKITKDFNADALVARKNLWRRVMRMVHPFDFVETDAERRALDIIHDNVEYRTLNALVESGLERGEVASVVALLQEHQPGNLLRRIVALLRSASWVSDVIALATAVQEVGQNSTLSTLISAYNGVLSINDTTQKLTRAAGHNNALVEQKDRKPVNAQWVAKIVSSVEGAITTKLATVESPTAPVGVVSENPVPLVRRDASTADRVLDRGERFSLIGENDTVRIFGHWRNNQKRSGYMDVGAVILDENFVNVQVITWNTWSGGRDWATYSGDKLVDSGDSAAEYIDVDVQKLRNVYPNARYIAMTIQSWSGFPTVNVDMLAGVMVRSRPNSGEVFEPRTVDTAFKPTTSALQSVPLVVDLSSGEMIWIDSSSGSTKAGVSAAYDDAVGTIVYNEIVRPRMTMGELAQLWATAHNVATTQEPVDRESVLNLLN